MFGCGLCTLCDMAQCLWLRFSDGGGNEFYTGSVVLGKVYYINPIFKTTRGNRSSVCRNLNFLPTVVS